MSLANRVQMTVSGTPGTGTITLGSATSGFQTFAAGGVVDGEIVSYLLVDGTAWEIGLGTYSSTGTTLARTFIRESTNAGAAINASSSTVVSIAALAENIGQRGFAVNRPGAYQFSPSFSAVNATVAAVANTAYLQPTWFSRRQVVTRIGFRVTTAAGTNGRVGLYTDHPTLAQPHILVVDSGNLGTGTTGDREAVISATVGPGMYWLVLVCDGAPTLGGGTVAALANGAGTSSSFIRGWTTSLTFGVLPADASGWTLTDVTSGNFIAPWVRAL